MFENCLKQTLKLRLRYYADHKDHQGTTELSVQSNNLRISPALLSCSDIAEEILSERAEIGGAVPYICCCMFSTAGEAAQTARHVPGGHSSQCGRLDSLSGLLPGQPAWSGLTYKQGPTKCPELRHSCLAGQNFKK